MLSRTNRFHMRVFVVLAATSLFLTVAASPVSAEPMKGVRIEGDPNADGVVKIISDFGPAASAEVLLWNTEVRNSANKKVAQWTESRAFKPGENVVLGHSWNSAGLSPGEYHFEQGISKPNWSGIIAWNANGGKVNIAAGASWDVSTSVQVAPDASGTIEVNAKFVRASSATGAFTLDTNVFDGNDRHVQQWSQVVDASAVATFTQNYSLSRAQLSPGNYRVEQGVYAGTWGPSVYFKQNAAEFKVPATAPATQERATTPTTTTTIAPAVTAARVANPTTTTTTTVAPAVTRRSVEGPWSEIFNDDFETNVAEGEFLGTYGSKWDAYPLGWLDTSKRGTYDPGIISVNDGALNMRLHTQNGVHRVAAPVPKIGTSGQNQLYGRYEVRFRADAVDGYKLAWLLWPESEVWPRDGEINFPEGDLDSSIAAFMHRQNGTSGGDQDAYATDARFTDWHTATLEWMPNKMNFFLDGELVGSSTKRVPNTPMHFVLQTETKLDGSVPSNTSGNVQLDRITIWKYNG